MDLTSRKKGTRKEQTEVDVNVSFTCHSMLYYCVLRFVTH